MLSIKSRYLPYREQGWYENFVDRLPLCICSHLPSHLTWFSTKNYLWGVAWKVLLLRPVALVWFYWWNPKHCSYICGKRLWCPCGCGQSPIHHKECCAAITEMWENSDKYGGVL